MLHGHRLVLGVMQHARAIHTHTHTLWLLMKNTAFQFDTFNNLLASKYFLRSQHIIRISGLGGGGEGGRGRQALWVPCITEGERFTYLQKIKKYVITRISNNIKQNHTYIPKQTSKH